MTPIQKKFEESGGASGFLGTPITGEITRPDGLGIYREFLHGIIYYSADYGACIMKESIINKWKSDSVAKSFTADNKTTVRDYLGFPLQDTLTVSPDIDACYFERGMIISTQGGMIGFAVYGAIYLVYRKNNDIKGWMGCPKSDEQPSYNGGRVSWFDNADIYWHPDAGAFEVHGGIKKKYNLLGASGSILGYPTSDENSIQSEGTEIGRSGNFQFGTIYWSVSTGAFEMHGWLWQSYMKNFKGPAGELGFPTSDETKSPKDLFRFNNFQNGVLIFRMADGNTIRVSSLKVFVTHLESNDDDNDLLVNTTTSLRSPETQMQEIKKTFGEYSNQGTKTLNEQEGYIGEFQLRDGNALLQVDMEAKEADNFLNLDDDLLGNLKRVFNIDTLWDSTSPDIFGITELTKFTGDNNNYFKASLRIELDDFIANPFDSENFRKDLFWNFHNPKVEEFDIPTYASTYSDVEEDDTYGNNMFNMAFYDAFYKHSAKAGTCFGMCLEAVYALKNRSSSRQPIGQYPLDEVRLHDISVKFGYQLGGDQMSYFLKTVMSGDAWNPKLAFIRSRDAFNNGNFSILCLSDPDDIMRGHAVIPYFWDDFTDPNEWKIYVANPNSPYNEHAENTFWNSVIKIGPGNTFVYQHGDKDIWTGGEAFGNGGRMIVFPYNELSSEPRTPFREAFFALITGGISLFASGDADIEQITDENERQYFDANGLLNVNPATRIKNLTHMGVLADPGGAVFSGYKGNSQRNDQVIYANRFQLPEKPRLFYQKSDLPKGQMYVERPLIESAPVSHTISRFNTHFGTAIQSRVFANNLTRTSYANEIIATRFSTDVLKIDSGLLSTLNKRSLTVEVKGTRDGNYIFALATGKSKIMISANALSDFADQITIDSINRAGQAFTFKANENASSKKVKISVLSFDQNRMYELNNISLLAGGILTLQFSNNCKEMILHNSNQELNFDLKLFAGKDLLNSIVKSSVKVEANNVLHLEPLIDWEKDNISTQVEIKMDIYKSFGGQLLETKII